MESIPHTRTGPPACAGHEHGTAEWRCAICGGESRHLFAKHGFGIRGCRSCAHQFAELEPDAGHAARIYGDDYFFGGTAGYGDYLSEARLLRAHGSRYARLLASHLAPGRVLDVGAAAGFVLEGLLDDGWTGAAVEPHFGDLRRGLAAAAAATAPHGWWFIETWNRDDWVARLLGRHWHEYSPPSVLHWFNPDGLRRLVSEFGFEQVAIGRPRKRLNAGHAKSLLRFHAARNHFGAFATLADTLVPDRLILPYPFTDLFWALFRRR